MKMLSVYHLMYFVFAVRTASVGLADFQTSFPSVALRSYRSRISTLVAQNDSRDLGHLLIRCLHNCENGKVNGFDPVVLQAACDECPLDSIGRIENFKWKIELTVPDKQKATTFNFETMTAGGEKNPVLHVLREKLPEASVVHVTAEVLDRRSETLILTVMSRRTKVTCAIVPTEGHAFVTNFAISCHDLKLPEGHILEKVEFYQAFNRIRLLNYKLEASVLHYGTSLQATHLVLVEGVKERNYSTSVVVQFFDNYSMYSFRNVRLKVKPFPLPDSCKLGPVNCLADIFVLNKTNPSETHLRRLVADGNVQGAIVMVQAIAYTMRIYKADDHLTPLVFEMRQEMMNILNYSPLDSFGSLVQTSYAMHSVFHQDCIGFYLDTKTAALNMLLKISMQLGLLDENSNQRNLWLRRLTASAWPTVQHAFQRRSLEATCLRFALGSITYSVESIYKITYKQTAESYVKTLYQQQTNAIGMPVQMYDFETFLNHTHKEMIEKENYILEEIWHNIGTSLLKFAFADQSFILLGDMVFRIYYEKARYGDLAGRKILFPNLTSEASEAFVRFPQWPERNNSIVYLMMVSYEKHPLDGLPSDDAEDGPPLSVSLFDPEKQEDIEAFPSDVEILITNDGSARWGETVEVPLKLREDLNNSDIGTLGVTTGEESLLLYTSPVRLQDKMELVIQKDAPPVVEDFTANNVLIISGLFPLKKTLNNYLYEKYGLSPSSPPSMLYFGVLPDNTTVISSLDNSQEGIAVEPDVFVYNMSLYGLSCRRRNPETTSWDSTACVVATSCHNSFNRVHCLCSSLSLFSGRAKPKQLSRDVLRPPGFEFELKVARPLTIVLCMIIILLLFLILLLLAILVDCQQSYNESVTVIKDNDPVYEHSYLVSVNTSYRFGSGTSSSVAVKLVGSSGSTPVHVLSSSYLRLFQRGTSSHFLVVTQQSLGTISDLSLYVEPKGSNRCWYVHDVRVYDLNSDDAFRFKANEWVCTLSSDTEVQQVNLSGEPITKNEQNYSLHYKQRLIRNFHDDYIWTSFLLRTPAASFASVGRVLLMLLLVLLAFFVNMLLRGVPSHAPVQHISEYGFNVRACDIGLACATAAVIVAVAILAVFLIRTAVRIKRWDVYIDLDPNWPSKQSLVEQSPEAESSELQLVRRTELVIFVKAEDKKPVEIKLESLTPRVVRKGVPVLSAGRSDDAPAEEEQVATDASETRSVACRDELRCTKRQWFIWFVLTVCIILLLVCNLYFGLDYSKTDVWLWIFSSLSAILICAVIMHPLAIIIYSSFCKGSGNLEKLNALCTLLDKVFAIRKTQITNRGTFEDYQQYLEILRHQNIYEAGSRDPHITDK